MHSNSTGPMFGHLIALQIFISSSGSAGHGHHLGFISETIPQGLPTTDLQHVNLSGVRLCCDECEESWQSASPQSKVGGRRLMHKSFQLNPEGVLGFWLLRMRTCQFDERALNNYLNV